MQHEKRYVEKLSGLFQARVTEGAAADITELAAVKLNDPFEIH
jgi:hypothetical protein